MASRYSEILGEEETLNAAQKRTGTAMKELQESILAGKHSEGDPIVDFCIANYGMDARKHEPKAREIASALRHGDILIINERTEIREPRGCFGSPHVTPEEFRRYGTLMAAADWTSRMKEGVILPMRHYAWERNYGFLAGPWNVQDDLIIITAEEIANGKLYAFSNKTLPEEIKQFHKWDSGKSRQKFEILAGNALKERLELYDDLSQDRAMGGKKPKDYPGAGKEARLVANEGMNFEAFREKQKTELRAYQEVVLRALCDSFYEKFVINPKPIRIQCLKDAIAVGLDKEDAHFEYRPGMTVMPSKFIASEFGSYQKYL